MNTKHLIGTVFDTVLKIVIIIVVVMFTYKYATEAYNFGYRIFSEKPVAEEGNAKVISIAITGEASTKDIGEVLEEKGLINDANLFYVQELLSEYHGKLKPGIYELSSDMTTKEMMAIMATQDAEGEADEESQGAEDGLNTSEEAGTEEDSGEAEDAQDTGME
ncbi:MAG: aminodeoxychorismate lyase [Clostridiales bacterium]|nr:aminodeoxychorismate lyase [Clostridiales bacterium]